MEIKSKALRHGQPVPRKYTDDGEDASPPLQVSEVPENAKSLALIVDDPDAPRGRFVHWVVWNIPIEDLSWGENKHFPYVGTNDFMQRQWRGPAPPKGAHHRYFFKVYALDSKLTLRDGATAADLEEAMEGHILAQAELMATYQR